MLNLNYIRKLKCILDEPGTWAEIGSLKTTSSHYYFYIVSGADPKFTLVDKLDRKLSKRVLKINVDSHSPYPDCLIRMG